MNGHSGPVSENLSMRAGVGRSTRHPTRRTDGDPAEPLSLWRRQRLSGNPEQAADHARSGHARARPRCPGRRLRRHRHQPALHHARGLRPCRRPAPGRGRCAGRPLARLLVADPRLSRSSTSSSSCGPTIAARAGCWRSARLRHAPAEHASTPPPRLRAGDRRPRSLLRRRPDHARDLGALGGRRVSDRATGAGGLRGADRRPRAARPLPGPEPRHGPRRQALRPGDAGLVRDLGPAWALLRSSRTRACSPLSTRAMRSVCSRSPAGRPSLPWVPSSLP